MRLDLLFVGAVFACWTQPELVVHQRPSRHDARRELGVAGWADLQCVPIVRAAHLTIVWYQCFTTRAFRLIRATVFWIIPAM
jgi:hypothetical protein